MNQKKHPKLIRLYSKLSKKDLEEFSLYLKKQAAQEKKVNKLHNGLKDVHPSLDEITQNWLYLVVYDVSPEGEKLLKEESNRLRRVTNKLVKHINRFIIQGERKNKIDDLIDLVMGYLRRGLFDLALLTLNKIEKELEKEKGQNIETFLKKFRVHALKVHLAIIKEDHTVSFQEMLNSLNDFLLCSYLRTSCAAQMREEVLNVKHYFPMLAEIYAYLDKTSHAKVPVLATIYRHIIDLLSDNLSSGDLEKVIKLIEEHEEDIPKAEQRQMYGFITNHLNDKIRKGQEHYRKNLFDIYVFTLDKKIWTEGIPHLSERQFLTIVRNALGYEKQEWAVSFIEEYAKYLIPEYRKSIPALAMAYVAFLNADYEMANKYLQKVGADKLETKPFYNYYYRVLEIRILYETLNRTKRSGREENRLSHLIEAFRIKLERTIKESKGKLSQKTNLRFRNFVSRIKRIYRYRFENSFKKGSPVILNNIKNDILAPEPLVDRKWLLEKTEELLEKK